MVRAVVFDAYGTLLDVESLAEVCESHFPSQGTAISELWRRKQLEYTWLLSLMGRYQDFWEVTRMGLNFACAARGVFLSEESQAQMMQAYLELPPFPEAVASLKQLADHFPLAVLSNGEEKMLDEALKASGLQVYISETLSANSTGVYKPSPKVYDLAVQAFFARPEEIVFVSSNAWDVAGAKSHGFRVAWCNRKAQPYDAHAQAPDWTLKSLEELPRLLR